MAKFLVKGRFHVHHEEMRAVNRRSKQVAIEHFPDISWDHSHVIVDDAGSVTTYRVCEAPSEEGASTRRRVRVPRR